tara:strand:+ start:1042 stop:1563 length:522 start_codon:yes stop_codon:yes gene_type:complete
MENICDRKFCKKIGEYKAPIERDNSKKFKWLCLEHIKEFNRSWDYFKGMSDQEVCEFLKADMTWHKPTQSFNSPDNFFNILWKNTLNEEGKILNNGKETKFNQKANFSYKDKEAFKIMDLEAGTNWEKIKNQFKKLVKKYHPDMNAGNKKFEEKLKIITLAYTQLKLTYKEIR